MRFVFASFLIRYSTGFQDDGQCPAGSACLAVRTTELPGSCYLAWIWARRYQGWNCHSRQEGLRSKAWNQRPETLMRANITKRPSMSNAALKMRISCVLGSTYRQTKAHNTAISDMRKTKDTISLSIHLQYPILTHKSSKKCSKLTIGLSRKRQDWQGNR